MKLNFTKGHFQTPPLPQAVTTYCKLLQPVLTNIILHQYY